MAGEIQLNSTTMATESSGSITAQLDTIRPNTTNGSLVLQGDSSDAGVTGLTIDSSGNATFAQTISGGTIGSSVVFPSGVITHTVHAFEASSNWIETTSTSYQASGIIVNAGTAATSESVILQCTIRNSSPFQANLIATYYHKIGTGGTYADLLSNNGSGGGARFFLQYDTDYYPLQPFTMYFVHTSPSTSDDNYYQVYFRSATSGQKARLAWFSSGIEITAQRVKLNSSTDLNL